MTQFVEVPIETDPPALAEAAFEYLEGAIPGWAASPGNLDTLLIEAVSEMAAEQAEVASAVLTSIFRYFGGLVGVPPIDAVSATATATFTVKDTAGYLIPAGAEVGLRNSDGELVGFEVIVDTAVAPGATTAPVLLAAATPGDEANGLSGAAELVTTPAFVTGALISVPATGGTDAEDDDVYLDRLAETLTLLSPRPILPNDFAVLARSIAGVYRASAVDGLKPGPPYSGTAEATGQERTITVALTDVNGDPVPSGTRTAVDTFLQSEREQTFAVYVVDPNYTAIDVIATVQAWPGFDTATVDAAATAALQEFLSPNVWAAGSDGDPTTWLNDPTVRLGELYEVLNAVDGVRYVTALTFGLQGGAMATTNVTLGSGSAVPALPRPGTGIAVTVTPG